MENRDEIGSLFFELASENRLGILRKLQSNNLRMQEVARSQDMTATETVRQLKRLSEAFLLERRPEGSYTITQYGKLVLHLSSSLDFVFNHRKYFLSHDVWRLPLQFVNRLGELSQTSLKTDMMESISAIERMISEAKQYVWGIGEGRFTETMSRTGTEQVSRGIEYRVITPLPPVKLQAIETRTLSDIPVKAALTENEAVVCFRLIEARADYAGFFGKDSAFLNWVKDLFLYYWDKTDWRKQEVPL